MIFVWLFEAMFSIVGWLIQQFPLIDWTPITDRLAGVGRVVGWIMQLNSFFPMVELIAAGTVLMTVWTVMYGVMTVRRIFSLIWPGAGS